MSITNIGNKQTIIIQNCLITIFICDLVVTPHKQRNRSKQHSQKETSLIKNFKKKCFQENATPLQNQLLQG